MPGLSPIPQRRSAVDDAFEAIRLRILHGDWLPGEPVPTERELTEALQVSRSTVREALNRLASAGLIAIPHGGTKRVLDWRDHAGIEVLADLLVDPHGQLDPAIGRSAVQMRDGIAPHVAQLAAVYRTDAQAARLVALADALDPEQSLLELLEATLAWWTALVEASHNIGYRLAYNTLRQTYTEGRGPMLALMAEELCAVELYRTIARAVADQDGALARQTCEELVAIGSSALFAALSALPSR